ncbi:MAG: PEP-CTERM sorting domain-containing protein [Deltaproteobacteria bacterium]|nr:PEP-CTERM sorting domain-containing protein [Deltaproteobacteria bacterium]
MPITPVEVDGYDVTSSEMGHLYYSSLLKPAGGPLDDPDPFENLPAKEYWSGTEYSANTYFAWAFDFSDGDQFVGGFLFSMGKYEFYQALAVRPGEVGTAPIPEPACMLLMASGLLAFAALRRKFKN